MGFGRFFQKKILGQRSHHRRHEDNSQALVAMQQKKEEERKLALQKEELEKKLQLEKEKLECQKYVAAKQVEREENWGKVVKHAVDKEVERDITRSKIKAKALKEMHGNAMVALTEMCKAGADPIAAATGVKRVYNLDQLAEDSDEEEDLLTRGIKRVRRE